MPVARARLLVTIANLLIAGWVRYVRAGLASEASRRTPSAAIIRTRMLPPMYRRFLGLEPGVGRSDIRRANTREQHLEAKGQLAKGEKVRRALHWMGLREQHLDGGQGAVGQGREGEAGSLSRAGIQVSYTGWVA